jgi:hypothetical protein
MYKSRAYFLLEKNMKITHPSMSNVTAESQSESSSAPKVHIVAPPDDDDALFEQQMALMEKEVATEQAVRKEAPSLPEDPALKKEVEKKMAFEKLMFLSQDKYKDVEYGGLTFKFKVLKSSDNAKILEILQESNLNEVYQASVMSLAASLVSVNGIAFEDFYTGSDPISSPILRRYSELSRWPAFMVTALMAFSTAVQREVETEFNKSFLKN